MTTDWQGALQEVSAKLAKEAPPVEEAAPEAVAAPVEDAEPVAETSAEKRARDDKGRFAPKESSEEPAGKAAAAPPVAEPKDKAQEGAVAAPPASAPPALAVPQERPPASWKPSEREQWGKVPPEARAAILRREGDISKGLQEAAPAKALREAIAPFEGIIRGRGAEAPQVIAHLLNREVQLINGTPAQRASLIAQAIKEYGIDPNAIADAMEGKGAQPTQSAPPPRAPSPQEQEAQFQTFLEKKAVQEFEASAPEFLTDVIDELFAVVSIEKQRGKAISVDLLKQAYDRACQINPEVSATLAQRKAAETAQAAAVTTQRAKTAASSVQSRPGGATATPAPKDWNEAIRAQLQK